MKPGERVKAIKPRSLEQTDNPRHTLTRSERAGKQPVFPPHRNGPNAILDRQIIDPWTGGEEGGSGDGWFGWPHAYLPGRVNPQLKALSEGRLAGVAHTLQGANLITGHLLDSIRYNQAHGEFTLQDYGLVPFIVFNGDHSRYNSGSHIDAEGFSMAGGLNYIYRGLTVGVFAEGGWGDYDSYNSFTNAARVHGKGDIRYYGGGLIGQYVFDNKLYVQGSLRAGTTKTNFDSMDIRSAEGLWARYDISSGYVGAHAGLGYILDFDERNSLDVSAKYFWTRVEGSSVNIAGDPIHFDAVDSHRLRAVAQFNHRYSERATFNIALGYEYELDAKAAATTYQHYRIDAPELKGGTGIIQIGANIRPVASGDGRGFSIDLKLNGYVGKREGIGGALQFNYQF